MGVCDFNDPQGTTFRMRVVELERRTKGDITYLGASMLLREDEWSAEQIADLYFGRWPNQEANFRVVNQAVGLKDVHGYGKQLVDNISVLTELDKLDGQMRREQVRQEKAMIQQQQASVALKEAKQDLRRTQGRQQTVNRQLQQRIEQGTVITQKLQGLIDEQHHLATETLRGTAAVDTLHKQQDQLQTKIEQISTTLDRCANRQDVLDGRRRIFRHDVELDSLFSVLKVGLVMLITYVLKEYFGDACMDAVTFLERVATLPAHLRLTPELEILTFEYNRRDPDVMAIIEQQCEAINDRQIRMQSGRILRILVEPPPPPRRPPPRNRRTTPGDRFRKK